MFKFQVIEAFDRLDSLDALDSTGSFLYRDRVAALIHFLATLFLQGIGQVTEPMLMLAGLHGWLVERHLDFSRGFFCLAFTWTVLCADLGEVKHLSELF